MTFAKWMTPGLQNTVVTQTFWIRNHPPTLEPARMLFTGGRLSYRDLAVPGKEHTSASRDAGHNVINGGEEEEKQEEREYEEEEDNN